MAASSIYGVCSRCNYSLSPVYFREEERNKQNVLTGRVRKACSHLVCECCGKQECVDDTFDGPFFTPSEHTRR